MGSFGRALGFLAGGMAKGAGEGIVEQAKLNWQKMLHDESEARADARETSRRSFEAGEKAKDRTIRSEEIKSDMELKREEIKTRAEQTRAQMDETRAYREQTRADNQQYRRDQLEIRRREVEGREANRTDRPGFSTEQMNLIEVAQKAAGISEFSTEEDVAEAAPKIVERLRQADPKLATRYGALFGVAEPQAPAGAAPGFARGWSPLTSSAPPKAETPAPAATSAPPANAAPGLGATAKETSGPPPADPEAEKQAVLQSARDAIARGADPEKVKERLRANGIDPSGL